MSELPRQHEEAVVEVDSRFGDKEHLHQLLLTGEAKLLGSIDELLEISPHQNAVELAEIVHFHQYNDNGRPKNLLSTYYFGEEGNRPILGIFKGVDGENPYVREQYSIDRLDIREVLAYDVSEHFGLDLVPPTVHREINGQLGSLQLFMPNDHYETVEWVEQHSGQSHFDFGRNSTDWEMMAAFDYIIANPDRHARNVMVKYAKDPDNKIIIPEDKYGAELIAIDNGTSFSTKGYYSRDTVVSGPNSDMTYSIAERQPLTLEIPDYLLEVLRRGLSNRADLHLQRYKDIISPSELQAMWQRAEDLVKQKVFLSRYNERHVFGG